MTAFVPGKPVVTVEPVVVVDEGIAAGTHVFELVVEDDDGNLSQPARAVVVVTGRDHGTGTVGAIGTELTGGRLAGAVEGPAVEGPAVEGPAVEGPAVEGPAPGPVVTPAPTRPARRILRRRGPAPPG